VARHGGALAARAGGHPFLFQRFNNREAELNVNGGALL